MSPRLLYLLSQHSLVDARDRRDARIAARRMSHNARRRNGVLRFPVGAARPRCPEGLPESNSDHDLSIVTRGGGSHVAELWLGSALFGLLHAENGDVVLRLESVAQGQWIVGAKALEHALTAAQESLRV